MAPDPLTAPDTAAAEFERLLARFVKYHPDRIELSLDRMYRLLGELGDPHRAMPPVIHVAGTNGKGSTVAMIAAALEIAGKTLSVYTSPHLTRFGERYHVAGATLSDDALLSLFEEVDRINAGKPITEFEVTTAAAFLAMARAPADVAIVEVGLGGRYDATNVFDAPAATVITRVGLDHQEFLGDNLAAIAHEKAGILKPNVPAVVAPQEPDAGRAIAVAARDVGAPPYRAGIEWTLEPGRDGGGTYRRGDTVWPLPPPGLLGRHQLDNAATAAACLDVCNFPGVTRDAIVQGLRNVTWPGRTEWLQRGDLAERLPQGWELWLDAAHNPQAAQALAATFGALSARDGRPLHLIFAVLADKDLDGFLAPFRGLAASATAVPIENEIRARPAEELAAAARAAGLDARAAASVRAALEPIVREDGPARVLIAGSHLLVGAAIRENRSSTPRWLDQVGGGHYCAH